MLIFVAIPVLCLASTIAATTPPPFNVTAITTVNNSSRLQCWTLPSPPLTGAGALSYTIGDFKNGFIGIVPARKYKNQTITHAPVIQFTIAITGLTHIRTPYSGLPDYLNEVWVKGGKYGFVIAADTVASGSTLGHVTEFPSDEPTWLIELPVMGHLVEHQVLYDGPCRIGDLVGI